MSTQTQKSLQGAVDVVARTPTFLERYAEKFGMPSQDRMRHIMRATIAGCAWNTSSWTLARRERARLASKNEPIPFQIFSLKEYSAFGSGTMGAPMPVHVSDHIKAVKAEFPGTAVRIHAHPWDDPLVEYLDETTGESLFAMAWRRNAGGVVTLYPRPRSRWLKFLG